MLFRRKDTIFAAIMIVSASYRTDIPAFYGDWFVERLRRGYCRVANPYGGPPSTVSLDPSDVDGFVFWTRNAAPFVPALGEVEALAIPSVFQFTIAGYPRAIDTSVIDPENAVSQLRSLAERLGPRSTVWRYDPIVLSSVTGEAWHRANFRFLASRLAGATDEVVVSFMAPYRKTRRNLDAAARRAGFEWFDPDDDRKRNLLAEIGEIAEQHGMRLTLCTQPELETEGIRAARCIDAERLSDVAGHGVKARTKGNRPGCLCSESRDIGAYDTCPHGCAYCYAVSSPQAAKRSYRLHDRHADSLSPARQAAAQAVVSTRRSSGSPLATPTMAARSSRPLRT